MGHSTNRPFGQFTMERTMFATFLVALGALLLAAASGAVLDPGAHQTERESR